MESVVKVDETVHEGRIEVNDLPFAEGERVEAMVWSPAADNLAPEPPAVRTPTRGRQP